MKKISLFILVTILLTACSTKSTTTLYKCQNIQNEIDNLNKEKYSDLAAITTITLTGRYHTNGEEKHLDQRIQILKLELSECERI